MKPVHRRTYANDPGVLSSDAAWRTDAQLANDAYLERAWDLIARHANRGRVSLAEAAVMLCNGKVP
jgi:hypothetical protein